MKKIDSQVIIVLVMLGVVLGGLYLFLDKRRREEKFVNYVNEGFISSNDESSSQSVAAGASMEYGWGYDEIASALEKIKNTVGKAPAPAPASSSSPSCASPSPAPSTTTTTTLPSNCPTNDCNKCFSAKKPEFCSQIGECPIEKHPDFNKYVLKASIPPPPDMSEYIRKSELPSQPDMKDYMLRTECKPVPQPDLNNYMLKSECRAFREEGNREDYILKSEIQACPTCPTCPEPKKFYTPSPAQIVKEIVYTPSVAFSSPSGSLLNEGENDRVGDRVNVGRRDNKEDGKKSKWNNNSRCDLGKFFY